MGASDHKFKVLSDLGFSIFVGHVGDNRPGKISYECLCPYQTSSKETTTNSILISSAFHIFSFLVYSQRPKDHGGKGTIHIELESHSNAKHNLFCQQCP